IYPGAKHRGSNGMFGKKPLRGAVAGLLLGALLVAGGCGLQSGAGPGKGPPAQHGQTGQQQPLPEKTAEIAGVKVTAGGGTVKDGIIHLASYDVPGGMIDFEPGTLLSPDGRWIAFQVAQKGWGDGLWVMALDGSGGKLLARVDEKEHQSGRMILRLLGWTRDNRVVYSRQGTQPDGAHRGQQGISLRVAAPGQEEEREAAWLPVPAGMIRQLKFLPGKESVFVQASRTLWQVDLAGGRKTLLKDNLPSYDGLFYPRLSPTGGSYVYELWEPHKKGIYSLDTGNSKEKALALNGETWNFMPQFSPDGSYLAYYAASLKPGRSAASARYAGDYNTVAEEDGPAPVAAGVDIITSGGQKVARLTVPGAMIANFQWAADGKHLAFATGNPGQAGSTTGGTWEGTAMKWQALWVADRQGKMHQVADLLDLSAGVNIQILNISPDGKQVHYGIINHDKQTLWLARDGSRPVEVAPGAGSWRYTVPVAVYGDDFFLIGEEIYRIHGAQATQITTDGGGKTALEVEGKRLVYVRSDRPDNWNGGRITVLSYGS
ncbi:MAG: hypothetical protein M1543_01800, partial [Firmicutes bacterium]|nr:hypothetical protein [Bacillota bacterium]